MKFAVAVATVVAAAYGQSINDIPSCAVPCIKSSITKVTGCADTDIKCACGSFQAVGTDALGCVDSACGTDQAINQVLPAVKKLCGQ